MKTNQYIAVVKDADNVIQEIACTQISMNNVGGTQIMGYIEGGSIGWETTLAVIPATYIVLLVDFPPYIPPTPKETIEEFYTMILSFLQSEYKKNPFPFFTKVELINMFGTGSKEELNELKQNGSIRKRKGINGDLVELLKFE